MNDILKAYEKKLYRYQFIKSQIEDLKSSNERSLKSLKKQEKVKAIIQHVAEETQNEITYKLSELVTLCFRAIGKKYRMKVKFVPKRGKTECVLQLKKKGEIYDVYKQIGGGMLDLASFGLRLSVYNLTKTMPILVLDEPFRNLSKANVEKLSLVLKRLAKDLHIQIIMVTNIKDVDFISNADNVIKVKKVRGKSRVTKE